LFILYRWSFHWFLLSDTAKTWCCGRFRRRKNKRLCGAARTPAQSFLWLVPNRLDGLYRTLRENEQLHQKQLGSSFWHEQKSFSGWFLDDRADFFLGYALKMTQLAAVTGRIRPGQRI
jgi:hypothetical protein